MSTLAICFGLIDLKHPISGAWHGRGFGRRFVWTYACPDCGRPVTVRVNSWRGRTPEPSLGAIGCPHPAAPVVPDK